MAFRSRPDEKTARFNAGLARPNDCARRYLFGRTGNSLYNWKLFQSGVDLSTNLFATAFFTLTGFHGLHVLIGLIALLIFLLVRLAGRFRFQTWFYSAFEEGRLLLALRRCRLDFRAVYCLHPSTGSMTTNQFFTTAWTWNSLVLIVICACVRGLLCGLRSNEAGQLDLTAAVGIFLLAVISPFGALADGYLFSAHMVQHILLVLIVPAFLLLSLPQSFSLRFPLTYLTHPLVGWVAGVGAMWLWHAPTLCNAAATLRSVSAIQTTSLLLMGKRVLVAGACPARGATALTACRDRLPLQPPALPAACSGSS